MKKIADNVAFEKSKQQDVSKAQIESLTKELKQLCQKVNQNMGYMKNDLAQSDAEYKHEPETHVKRTVHSTYTAKFHELLRVSQTLQQEFKNSLNSRVKRQIRVFKPDVTEEELSQMKGDPEAA